MIKVSLERRASSAACSAFRIGGEIKIVAPDPDLPILHLEHAAAGQIDRALTEFRSVQPFCDDCIA